MTLQRFRLPTLYAGGIVTAVIALSSCGPTTTTDASAGSSTAVAPATPVASATSDAPSVYKDFRWYPTGSGTVKVAGPPTTLSLVKDGAVFAVFDSLPAKAGETFTVKFSASGAEGRTVKFGMTRHCDPENGDDVGTNECKLSPVGQLCEVAHTFSKNFSCVRVDFYTADGEPTEVTISDLEITKK